MNMLLSSFKHNDPVKVVGYADDILLYVCGSDEFIMGNLMEAALERMTKCWQRMGWYSTPTKGQ